MNKVIATGLPTSLKELKDIETQIGDH